MLAQNVISEEDEYDFSEAEIMAAEQLLDEPWTFSETFFGDKLETYQVEKIMKPVRDYDRVAIKACHAVGKTFSMARIVLWFGQMHPHSKIITTAPTHRQVRLLLWSEIGMAFKRASERKTRLSGVMNLTEWKIDADWYAVGFTTATKATTEEGQGAASAFQGFHAPFILVVFDEATGISPQVWKMVEGLLTSGRVVKFVCIGNPTSRSTPFFKCFNGKESLVWHKESISCFDSPNLKVNGINNISDLYKEAEYIKALPEIEARQRIKNYKVVNPVLINTAWVIDRALSWGIEHPLFISKALADFPDEDEHTLITMSMFELALARENDGKDNEDYHMGVDPARQGPDSTVITVMKGSEVIDRRKYKKEDGPQVAGRVLEIMAEYQGQSVFRNVTIDGTGVGASCVDHLKYMRRTKKLSGSINIHEVHFGAGYEDDQHKDDEKKDRKQYSNLKAKIFDILQDSFKTDLTFKMKIGQFDRGLKNDDIETYQSEITQVRYWFDKKSEKMVIESKADYKLRTGMSSPDSADSLALCNYGRLLRPKAGKFTPSVAPETKGSGGGFSAPLGSGIDW